MIIGLNSKILKRLTSGHAYLLEYSNDGSLWTTCGRNNDIIIQMPHTDELNIKTCYLRIKGVWEWNIY